MSYAEMAGLAPIAMNPKSLAKIAEAVGHLERALLAIPPASTDSGVGLTIYNARAQAFSAQSVLKHLLERATLCN